MAITVKSNPIVFVLGMHRSGTSLIAQLISKWGAYMGDNLYGANEYNKDGYWEYVPLVELNEKILRFLGRTWYFPPEKINIDLLVDEFGYEAKQIVDKMDLSNSTWCWKDPRMVFLLPFWKKILENRNIVYVVSARNPLAIMQSLNKRDSMPFTIALSLWECTVSRIAFELHDEASFFVIEYDKLLTKPEENCNTLFTFLNSKLKQQKGKFEFEAMLNTVKPFMQTSVYQQNDLSVTHANLFEFYKKGDFVSIKKIKDSSLNNSFEVLKYFYESYQNVGFSYQIYFQTKNESFNESKSTLQKLPDNIEKIDIDLKSLDELKVIRFDQLNDWVVLKIENIILETVDNIFGNIGFSSNAYDESSEILIFNNDDPQIYIDLNKFHSHNLNKLTIQLKYIAMGAKAKVYFSDFFSKQMNDVFAILDINQLKDLNKKTLVDAIKQKISEEKNRYDDLLALSASKNNALEQQINDYKNQNIENTKELLTKNEIISEIKLKNEILISEIEKYSKEIIDLNEEKNKIIIQLREKIIEKNEEIVNKRKEIVSLTKENTSTTDLLIKEKQKLENYLVELKDKNQQIESLQNEIVCFKKSYTYKLVKSFSFIFLIFRPKIVFQTISQKRFIQRQIKMITRSEFFDKKYYLQHNSDVASSGINPAKHYLLYGGFEGRNPSEEFDSSYYLSIYQDVAKSGINPLLHYVLHGKYEGRSTRRENQETDHPAFNKPGTIEPPFPLLNENLSEHFYEPDEFQQQVNAIRESGMFDADYYYSEYPDVRDAGMDALEHYCMFGWHEGRNPNLTFETYYYLSVHKDVKESGTNPLLHYVIAGHKEGRQTQFIDANNTNELTFEKPVPFAFNKTQPSVKTIAFYLPQFHPIPENDEWWGRNFTEWTNVTRAKSQFVGHYQPHLPLDLGFYDLRIPDVMRQQAEMAKSFGINGFCFYYYWFGGKRLLEKPLDMFLEHKEWNIDFCMCWANENWTRRWDGQEKDVLIAQKHSPEDDIAFIDDIAKYILDPRYIKVDGKPIVIIYQPQIFPEIKATVKRWREHAKNKYNIDIYLTMVQTFGKYDPSEFDFDAAIEFPPHNVVPDLVTNIETNVEFIGTIHDAKSLVKISKNKLSNVNYELFRGVMLNWDNTARKGRRSNVFVNNEPLVYQEWLEEAIDDTLNNKKNDSKKIVFINAWNEWAEGTHLEPDQKYGYAYLNSTSRALELCSSVKNCLKIGVLIHAYYLDILPELLKYLKNIKEEFSILLSVSIGNREDAIIILKSHGFSKFIIKEVENVGFDIAPMICAFQSEIFEFDLICKIHTKKSTHNNIEFGKDWRNFCLDYLLKDEQSVRKIINEFNINEELGIIYPPGYPPVLDWIKKNGANLNQIEKILPKSLVPASFKNLVWPIGSFFWFRPAALQPIFDEKFILQDFEPKDFSLFDGNGTVRDLTLAHSIERVLCYVARSSGFKTYQIANTLFDDKLTYTKIYHKKGFCPVCSSETIFFSPDDWYRDHLHCRNCNSIPRNRAIFNVLNSIDPNWKSKRIHESSPNNRYFADVVCDYTFSQFYPDEKLGEMITGTRNENLEKLTFHNGEFDYFFTLDVLEHVFNPDIAIKEMLRVVNDHGAVVFTVPIHKHYESSVQRAKLDKNNKTIHLLPENYHGNPVGDGKSLVTWDYGQDFKSLVQNWIGKNYEISIFNEPIEQYGIIGDYLDVIVIRKLR